MSAGGAGVRRAGGGHAARRVLIDANVLYPTVLREVVLACARRGLFVPLWSARILAEWRHVAARGGAEHAAIAAADTALLRDRWPQAEIAPDPALEAGLSLPDADDTHVLAAAIAGRADLILTQNLRDFPPRILARHGLSALDPDRFLSACLASDRAEVLGAVDMVWQRARAFPEAPQTPRALLKKAGLPRLGRAVERLAGVPPAGGGEI